MWQWLWRLSRERLWRELILPGTLIIGLVCLVRLIGLLQTQEWMALDAFSRQCPVQEHPQRITLVTIDESDYEANGGFPISDQVMAQALAKLQAYQPRVVGLDIFRNLPTGAGQAELRQVMQSMPNLVAVEVTLNQEPTLNIDPPAWMPADQIGFADLVVDADGKLRRSVSAARDWEGTLKYSLAVQLVRRYLQAEDIPFRHGAGGGSDEEIRSTDPIRFGQVTLPRFRPNSGGYIRADANGNQMLMHFCMLQKPYATVSLSDLLAGRVEADQLRDRIVIIGTIATSIKDSFITSAVRQTLYSQRVSGPPTPTQLIYGVEIHAHAVKQILSSVLDRPCTLATWPDLGEYLWIIAWGLVGLSISVMLHSPWKSVISLAIATLCVMGIGYGFLNINWWIPVVPTALALVGAGLVTAFFDRDMRLELAQRRIAVERTYEAVHNGPLQHLAAILRSLGEHPLTADELRQQLQSLNVEMRNIFEHMRQDATARIDSLYLADSTVLDLRQPLPDLLYQVYEHTLNQSLPGFTSIRTYIPPNFECLTQSRFSPEQKRGLCLFLQAALLNIGKHAVGATRLDVICTEAPRHYQLQIIDNGQGLATGPVPIGEGTRQAIALAQHLKGRFERRANSPRGVICELVWPRRFGKSRLATTAS
ncbi:MAG: CHASE2 domain-containing protein [Cyanobacteria bacterium P01_G01_bin.38]